MPIGILFWGIYILCLIFGVWGYWAPTQAGWQQRVGGYLALWVLVGLLGWHIFGPAVR